MSNLILKGLSPPGIRFLNGDTSPALNGLSVRPSFGHDLMDPLGPKLYQSSAAGCYILIVRYINQKDKSQTIKFVKDKIKCLTRSMWEDSRLGHLWHSRFDLYPVTNLFADPWPISFDLQTLEVEADFRQAPIYLMATLIQIKSNPAWITNVIL